MITLFSKWVLLVRIVRDRKLPPSAVLVAVVILDHHNGATGRCNPSRETIAQQCGLTVRGVSKALSALVSRGYFTRQQRGFHHSNDYTPVVETMADEGGEGGNSSSRLHSDGNAGSRLDDEGGNVRARKAGTDVPPNTPIEHKKEGMPPILDAGAPSATSQGAAKRESRLYLAKYGCTIDSYNPRCSAMAAWISNNAWLVKDPLSEGTIEEIKDVWRRREVKPKNFDAMYRTYLRKRQEWALEKQHEEAAKHDPQLRAGMN